MDNNPLRISPTCFQVDENPLRISPTPTSVHNGEDLNKGGRPALGSIVKFGPQPRSIVAQMLSDMKSNAIIIEEEDPLEECPIQTEQPQDFVEGKKSEEFVCQSCSYRSCSVAEYKKHQSSHHKLICDYPNCSYSCKLSSNLIKHKRVHTNEKPYLCEKCSFRTNFVNSLKAHKRIHTAERPYQCDYCSYKCNSSSNLKKHCHLRHTDGNKCKHKYHKPNQIHTSHHKPNQCLPVTVMDSS